MTGMGRETGLARDQGQERPRMPGMLNPGGFGAMTAILDVRSRWRRKPGTLNGLTGDCRHRYRQDGKSGRYVYAVLPGNALSVVMDRFYHANLGNGDDALLRTSHRHRARGQAKSLGSGE